jgi:hypothetical protein
MTKTGDIVGKHAWPDSVWKQSHEIPAAITTTHPDHSPALLMAASLISIFLFQCSTQKNPAHPIPHAEILAQFEKWPDCGQGTRHESWYGLHLQGHRVGYEHRRSWSCETGLGFRTLHKIDEVFCFLREGHRIEHSTQSVFIENEQGATVRIQHKSTQKDHPPQVTHAGKVGNQMITIRGNEIQRARFESEAMDAERFFRKALHQPATTMGKKTLFRSFSHSQGTYVDNWVTVLSKDQTLVRLQHKSSDLPGLTNTVVLGPGSVPLSMTNVIGRVKMEKRLLDHAPRAELPNKPPSVDELMKIKTQGRIKKPALAKKVRYRIENLPPEINIENLNGPGQNVLQSPKPGTLLLETHQIIPAKNTRLFQNQPLACWLADTALAQSSHPAIRKLAQRLTSGTPDVWKKALNLRHWVANEIKSDLGMTFGSAVDVLSTGRGDCSEKSVLLTALARAVGIPARSVVGLVYHQGVFSGHMWTEVMLNNQWQPLDAALGPERPSAARIRLAVAPLGLSGNNNTETLMWMVSGVRIIVESVAH